MGDTGSLALGGALAAMAAISGMFLPLLVASGWFVGEAVSVLGQVRSFGSMTYVCVCVCLCVFFFFFFFFR